MYKRLPFEQYFIDASKGIGGTPSIEVDYSKVVYEYKKKSYNAYYCVLYNEARDVIQIFLKETTDETGWRANFDFGKKYYDEFFYNGKMISLKVHGGWGTMYKAMKHQIRFKFKELRIAHPTSEVEVIGWSLGSGQAQLCAQDIFYNYAIKCHVFTFGSVKPWYGFNKAMRKYLANCYIEAYNFYDHNDIVGYMPPFLGFFRFKNSKIKQDSFCLAKLFNPQKYHTEYWKKEYYKEVK